MYINEIDKLLDKILDDFYINITKSKLLVQLIDDDNFVKHQSKINEFIGKYAKSIDAEGIMKIVQHKENVDYIIELIKRYIAYYLFLSVGFFYQAKKETYINNIVEFSRNQSGFEFKIKSFFTGESNANLFDFYTQIKQITTVLQMDSNKLKKIASKSEYKESLTFLNELGTKFINTKFKFESVRGNKYDQCHNIVKTVILKKLYINKEKTTVYQIISSVEQEQGEYTFINIVVPRVVKADFNAIENILTMSEQRAGMGTELYEFITNNDERINKTTDDNIYKKIRNLIKNKYVIPIVDDFMLYHKDMEKYEKDEGDTRQKKENTKIKYIVNKIDNASDFYSLKNEKAKKVFYGQLKHRNAVLINDTEEIKIIDKLMNVGKTALEKNEYYSDLVSFRKYPYLNFKTMPNNGFSLHLDKLTDLVRYVSIQNIKGTNMPLQVRIGSNRSKVNIVGLMLSDKSIGCLSTRDIKSIEKWSKRTNNFNKFEEYFRKMLFKNERKEPVYWIVNPKTDKINSKEYIETKAQNESGLIVASLYDKMVEFVYAMILDALDKTKDKSFYNAFNIIEQYRSIINFPRDSELYQRLIKIVIHDKGKNAIERYDKNEDKFSGLFGKVIKISSVPKKEENNVVHIHVKREQTFDTNESEIDLGDSICQHFITFDNIMTVKKKSPNEYTEMLVEFVQRYVVENYESDLICRSCGTQLPLKDYLLGGVYDRGTGMFTTFSAPMTTPLNDIKEYSNLRNTIRNMDKMVEKVATVSNIVYFMGDSFNSRWNRNRIVKDVIDFLTTHSRNMEDIYKQRNEKATERYGVDKNISNMFIFNLDDKIFVITSKERDYYKMIKRNNILVYVIFMLIIELNKSQVIYLHRDKICNYYIFKKYGKILFNKLKIIVNKEGDIEDITNYPILCYLIYFMSCLSTKYGMWYRAEESSKKFDPNVQNTIIHTMVDILNSFLEIDTSKQNYLYGLILGRFFHKLNTVFKDNYISEMLDLAISQHIKKQDGKTRFIRPKIRKIKVPGRYIKIIHGFRKMKLIRPAVYNVPNIPNRKRKILKITGITNCSNGKFHDWEVAGKEFVCKVCNVKLSETESESLEDEYIKYQKERIAKLHTNKKIVSQKDIDDYDKSHNYRKDKMRSSYVRRKKRRYDSIKSKYDKYGGIVKKIQEQYNNTVKKQDKLAFLNNLIKTLKNIIGESIYLKHRKINVFMDDDQYIINHDKNGILLDKEIILRSNKVTYVENHSYFKTNVIYYTSYSKGRVDIYYDAINYNLLGYREDSKKYMQSHIRNRYLTINYGIKSRLKLMGYPSRYIYIRKNVYSLAKIYQKDFDRVAKHIMSDISRKRINHLKKFAFNVQRYLYRLKYRYKDDIEVKEGDEVKPDILEKYRKNLNKIKIRDDNNKKVFKKWEKILNNVRFKPSRSSIINLDTHSKYIDVENIINMDYSGNMLLYYICNEINRVIKINNNRFVKTNLIYLLIEIIIEIFELANFEEINKSIDIKRFKYVLSGSEYTFDVKQKVSQVGDIQLEDPQGIYGEYKDVDDKDTVEQLEQRFDDTSEMEGLDVDPSPDEDTEMDYQIDYSFERVVPIQQLEQIK